MMEHTTIKKGQIIRYVGRFEPTPVKLFIYITGETETLVKQLNADHNNAWSDGTLDDESGAFCTYVEVKDDHRRIIIALPEWNIVSLVHEAVHASWALAEECGLVFDKDEELQCYLVDRIVQRYLMMEDYAEDYIVNSKNVTPYEKSQGIDSVGWTPHYYERVWKVTESNE